MLAVKPEVITNFKGPTNATTANHTGLKETTIYIVLGRNTYCLKSALLTEIIFYPMQFVKDHRNNWASWYSGSPEFCKGKLPMLT